MQTPMYTITTQHYTALIGEDGEVEILQTYTPEEYRPNIVSSMALEILKLKQELQYALEQRNCECSYAEACKFAEERDEALRQSAEFQRIAGRLLNWGESVIGHLSSDPHPEDGGSEESKSLLEEYKTLPKPAGEVPETSTHFMYESVEEFEKIVGYKVKSVFKDGWRMARLTRPNN